MMKLLEWLNRFKDTYTKITSKHLLLISIALIIFLCAKIYVLSTPTPTDDNLPEKIVNSVLMIVFDTDECDDPNLTYCGDNQRA